MGDSLKEGEGISERTYMKDPWTGMTKWGLTTEVEVGLSGEDLREKNWNNCNSINNKVLKINKFKKRKKIKLSSKIMLWLN